MSFVSNLSPGMKCDREILTDKVETTVTVKTQASGPRPSVR